MAHARGIKPHRPSTISALVVLAVIVLVPPALDAQTPTKIARIGFLSASSPTAEGFSHLTFRQGLVDLGYSEGRDILIEYRWAHGNFERLPALAAELVRLNVDVIVAVVTQASLAAQKATTTIPIVMVGVADPVGAGLVGSLARPGGNITGTSSVAAEVVGKQIQLLKEALPAVSRVAVLWNPANSAFQAMQVREATNAARILGLELQMMQARTADEVDRVFAELKRERPGALLVLVDPLFGLNRQRIADLAASARLPTVGGERSWAEAGMAMAYGPSYPEIARRAAPYVDKILKGAKAADLPVEQPTKFELVVNLKRAKALGLTLPQSVLWRADDVIR